jgi:hypothetical protein
MRARREPPATAPARTLPARAAPVPYAAALQRAVGNRGLQRLARRTMLARQGQPWNVPIDPNTCSLTWTPGGPRWALPSGASCDPGMFGIDTPPGSGQFEYTPPWAQQSDPATQDPTVVRPRDCPPERWVPPSSGNGFIGHCAPATTSPPPLPDIPTPPPPSPPDYNDLPDLPDDGTAYA